MPETADAATLRLLDVLFSVPQVSVKLEEISNEHRAMIRHCLACWNANRVVLDGEFYPGNPGVTYLEAGVHRFKAPPSGRLTVATRSR